MSATVLLIAAQKDDHARVGQALAGIRGAPFRLETAGTLADGLARLKLGRIDAVMLDLNLPDSLGLTTFLRVQPKAPQIPVVVITDPTDDDLGRNAVDRGALDYLSKDQVTTQLLDKVLRYATERTHTLKALKASEQRYRELFQNVTAGVFQTTPDGKFMAANPALVRMLGYDSEDELLAVDVAQDIYMDPGHREAWVTEMAQGGEVRNAELVLKRRDGSKIVVLENSRAVRDSEGRVIFYEGTLTDITAAHELSQQLSYDASHDVLTGLAQPSRIRVAAAARNRDDAGNRRDARGVLPGPRPIQGGQRHLRARRRRRAAAPAGPRTAGQGAFRGCRGAPRR